MNLKKTIKILFLTGLVLSSIGLIRVVYYQAKANVAQAMIESVWNEREKTVKLINPENLKPWPWADTWPVMKIEFPEFSRSSLMNSNYISSNIVLKDDSGESLAFGPGLMTTDILPGDVGNSFIAAHRDTHFSSIGQLLKNNTIKITLHSGITHQFIIDRIKIVDSRTEQAWTATNEKRITLVTCYPFDGSIPNTPLRYLVSAIII